VLNWRRHGEAGAVYGARSQDLTERQGRIKFHSAALTQSCLNRTPIATLPNIRPSAFAALAQAAVLAERVSYVSAERRLKFSGRLPLCVRGIPVDAFTPSSTSFGWPCPRILSQLGI